MARVFTRNDGLVPVDLVHCALDHLTAAEHLFKIGPHLFDSAGYLAHLGLELLLKGWLLECHGSFVGTHSLLDLYQTLLAGHHTHPLSDRFEVALSKLDGYAELRYPNLHSPTSVGDPDLEEINLLAGEFCRTMPKSIEAELEKINSGDSDELIRKAGRVLMKKKRRDA